MELGEWQKQGYKKSWDIKVQVAEALLKHKYKFMGIFFSHAIWSQIRATIVAGRCLEYYVDGRSAP